MAKTPDFLSKSLKTHVSRERNKLLKTMNLATANKFLLKKARLGLLPHVFLQFLEHERRAKLRAKMQEYRDRKKVIHMQ